MQMFKHRLLKLTEISSFISWVLMNVFHCHNIKLVPLLTGKSPKCQTNPPSLCHLHLLNGLLISDLRFGVNINKPGVFVVRQMLQLMLHYMTLMWNRSQYEIKPKLFHSYISSI